ncbi:hypothetical protein RJT34_12186 [Clitoria ternatea]|uniref:Transmembrane protein n=1 Tax=Clitoria ternatea TaxID=43366 RepID=A0AAN9PJ33_CLITE
MTGAGEGQRRWEAGGRVLSWSISRQWGRVLVGDNGGRSKWVFAKGASQGWYGRSWLQRRRSVTSSSDGSSYSVLLLFFLFCVLLFLVNVLLESLLVFLLFL